jgi:putative oxidoreductase
MERVLGKIAPQLYALMRITIGLLFACHGAQKLFGVLGGRQVAIASHLGLAGAIELAGGLMVATGFLTGFAAFVAAGEMAYAYFTVHMRGSWWPIKNGGELALLYCSVLLYIASRGAGVWAVDRGGTKR